VEAAMMGDVPDETQHIPDGPLAPPSETRHVPDGPLPAAPAASSDAPLPTFGRFRATGTLGSGGMGTVYRAHDEMLGRDVAIKVLTGDGELGMRERFVREARAIGAVLHPNILAVHDVGDANGSPYLVMELAGHGSLRERVKAGPMPVETVREVGVQIARALAAAHAASIIHRDVKPGNILCSAPGAWKLADFGIARTPDSTLTITGQFLGSPSYAAPESLRAGQFGPASDVYSLGATLYEALAGTPPHGDHDMQSVIRKLEQDAPPIASRREVPGPLGDSIMAALSRDPARRPTAAQLAEQLALADHAAPLVPAPLAPARFAPVPAASSRRLVYALAGAAALALLIGVLATRGTSSSSRSFAAPADPFSRDKVAPGSDPAGGDDDEEGDAPEPAGVWSDVVGPGGEGQMPTVVDQYGNPVDDETARQILEQMQRDADSAVHGKGRGRGHKKRK
jgi:serine/threonine protein kinase